MTLKLSNSQIRQARDLNKDDVQQRVQQRTEAVHRKTPDSLLDGEVECDEVCVVAGHKGKPEAVKKRAWLKNTLVKYSVA